jgi:hypothetical protein
MPDNGWMTVSLLLGHILIVDATIGQCGIEENETIHVIQSLPGKVVPTGFRKGMTFDDVDNSQ